MAREAVQEALVMVTAPARAVQIYAATANAAFAERIANALNAEGVEVVTGDFALSGALAVIVVWSAASVGSKKLIAAARGPLDAGAVIPVSLGRVEPPLGFRRVQAVDLAAWSGALDDPRWRFVMDEIARLADARLAAAPALPHAAIAPLAEHDAAPSGSFDAWFEQAYIDEPARAPKAAASASRPEQRAAHVPPPPAAQDARPRMAGRLPLRMALLATSGLILAALAAMTILRDAKAPKGAVVASAPSAATPSPSGPQEAPTLAHVGPAPADEIPAATLVEEEAIVAPPTEPATVEGETDPIAALIAENAAETASSVKTPPTEQLTVPPPVGPASATVKDCSDCPELARIPAGSFRMGPGPSDLVKPGEGPAVDVTIAKPFALARTETTVAEWNLCVAAKACPALPGAASQRTPAVNVSWADVQGYLVFLSKKTGKTYRLPSVAEWEYAARAGGEDPLSFGKSVSAGEASFDGSLPWRGEAGPILRGPKRVASYEPNAFGLYDMHGNVWEWTADCWSPGHSGAPTDGSARGGGCAQRVLKGGAWNTGGWRLRAAHRIGKNAAAREFDNGFRVARD
jgi:formylglycine-generating enzyme required for sulfatase activity